MTHRELLQNILQDLVLVYADDEHRNDDKAYAMYNTARAFIIEIETHLAAHPEPAAPEKVGEVWVARNKTGKLLDVGVVRPPPYFACTHKMPSEFGFFLVPGDTPNWPVPTKRYIPGFWFTSFATHFMFEEMHPDLTLTPGEQCRIDIIQQDGRTWWQRADADVAP